MRNSIKSLLLTLLIISSYNASYSAVFSEPAFLPLHNSKSAYTPATAFGNGVFLTVWQSGRLQPGDLRLGPVYQSSLVFCRIDTLGNVLDDIPVVVADTTDLKESPKVVFGGGLFFLVWQDIRNGVDWNVYGSRISADGTVQDPNGFLISGGVHNQAYPRVAWDGTNFNVVWQDARSGSAYEVYMARVSLGGVVLEPEGIKVASGLASNLNPAIAAGGGDSLLVFSIGGNANFKENFYSNISNTRATFVSNGNVGTAPAYTVGSSGLKPTGGNLPIALAHGAGSFLLAWQNDVPFGRGNDMTKNNMSLFDGAVNRVKDLHIGFYNTDVKRIMNPDIVWDGSNYAVVWHEISTRNNQDISFDKVCAAVISDTGGMVVPETLVAGVSTAPALNACVAATESGIKLIAYEQQPNVAGIPVKIGYRMLGNGSLTGIDLSPESPTTVFSLSPNPFNPSVKVLLRITDKDGFAGKTVDRSLSVFDISGIRVASIVPSEVSYNNGKQVTCVWQWNAKQAASGAYVIRVNMGNGKTLTRKVMLMR
jgi:hypothetical protein